MAGEVKCDKCHQKLGILSISLLFIGSILVLAGTKHFYWTDDQPLLINDLGWFGFGCWVASGVVILLAASIKDPDEELESALYKARLEKAVEAGRVMRWHQLEGTQTGLRLVSDGKDVVMLRRRGPFSVRRSVGSTPQLAVELKTSTIWSDLTYKTVIIDLASNEVIGEYITRHGRDGDLLIKGRKYILTRWKKDILPHGHYVMDLNERKLAVTTDEIDTGLYNYEPLNIMPEDPDKWILALLQIHFIINFHGKG